MGPSTGLNDLGGQRLVTPPIRGRAGELKVIDALVTALVAARASQRWPGDPLPGRGAHQLADRSHAATLGTVGGCG